MGEPVMQPPVLASTSHSDDGPDASDATMRPGDFAIGREFETASGTWRCTDVGTRTIVAIKVSDHHDDPSWLTGPPYAVAEMVFDEDDFRECSHIGSSLS